MFRSIEVVWRMGECMKDKLIKPIKREATTATKTAPLDWDTSTARRTL